MRKNGFTLIELLAVIVILAVIALIATPAVLNIIEDSRKGAAEASARNIISAAKTYKMQETMKGNSVTAVDLTSNLFKYDGDQATKGYIEFDKDGKVTAKMYIRGYCVEIDTTNKATSKKMTEEECSLVDENETQVTYVKYNDGTPLYFNPTDGVKCNDTEAVSTTGTKSGCMKFYAFLDSESNSKVKLLLDHNTTAKVAWNSDVTKNTPNEVITALESDTTGWKQIVNDVETTLTARLISAEEVNRMAPLTPFSYEETDDMGYSVTKDVNEWNINDYSTWYYLHTGTQTAYQAGTGTNKYAWLFNNTNECEAQGCHTNASETNGYWTNTYANSNNAWLVGRGGVLNYLNIDAANGHGVRPVIEVSKEVFK